MTSQDPTQRLIANLGRDLVPVRRLAPLWVRMALFGMAWLTVLAYALLQSSLRPGLLLELHAAPVFTAVLSGLLLAGLGGGAAALASAVPGREGALRIAALVAGLGLLVALSFPLAGLLSLGWDVGSPPASDRACFARSLGFAALPTVTLLWLVLRGWVGKPHLAGALCLIGGVALGAWVADLFCPAGGPRHLLLGHASVPLALAVVGVLPAGLLLRRTAR